MASNLLFVSIGCSRVKAVEGRGEFTPRPPASPPPAQDLTFVAFANPSLDRSQRRFAASIQPNSIREPLAIPSHGAPDKSKGLRPVLA